MRADVRELDFYVHNITKSWIWSLVPLIIVGLCACMDSSGYGRNFTGSYSHATQFGEPWLAEGAPVKKGKACLSVMSQSGGSYRVEIYRVEGTPHICSVVGTGQVKAQKLVIKVDGTNGRPEGSLYLTQNSSGITVHDNSSRPSYCGAQASLDGLYFPTKERLAFGENGQCAME